MQLKTSYPGKISHCSWQNVTELAKICGQLTPDFTIVETEVGVGCNVGFSIREVQHPLFTNAPICFAHEFSCCTHKTVIHL